MPPKILERQDPYPADLYLTAAQVRARYGGATPRFVLASSAIRCRFVDRFVRRRVLSRVSRQRFSPHDTPLSSIGSR